MVKTLPFRGAGAAQIAEAIGTDGRTGRALVIGPEKHIYDICDDGKNEVGPELVQATMAGVFGAGFKTRFG